MAIKYKDQNVTLNFVPYSHNGNTAMEILDSRTNQSIEIVTVNIGQRLPKNIIMIKLLSGNAHDISELIKADIIKPQQQGEYTLGYANIVAYELTDEADTIRKEQYEMYQYELLFK